MYNTLQEEYNTLKSAHSTVSDRAKTLETEKAKLAQQTMILQESKRKLKSICDRYPKMEDLAKLLMGDLSFGRILSSVHSI
jgi:hypothetical protein